MDSELRKRLEEAALEMYPPRIGDIVYKHCDVNADTRETLIEGGTIGYELGFKEAIEVAKELLLEQGKLDKLDLVEFDIEINKLWEGEE